EVYVVGEAWCGNGNRVGFLTKLTTNLYLGQYPPTTWERRVFETPQGDSGAYALTIDANVVHVAGYRSTSGSRRAYFESFQASDGILLGGSWERAGNFPSAANAIMVDPVSQDFYVVGTEDVATDDHVGFVTRLNASRSLIWSATLYGARVYGVAVKNDGVYAVGGTRRYLPNWPETSPFSQLFVGRLIPDGRYLGFISKFDRSSGALRWKQSLNLGHVMALASDTQYGNLFLRIVGNELQPRCVAPPGTWCIRPPI